MEILRKQCVPLTIARARYLFLPAASGMNRRDNGGAFTCSDLASALEKGGAHHQNTGIVANSKTREDN